ncbi:translation initiation factor IF-2 [Actinomadura spongiicola]|uniref:Translation initiation factor IF-2 n=1 Tax=Actinomadura spongiicola TaxID=2303421 RepID=A0A372GI81_9ACTN|nr:translation initiation factor IF-2 [Actinomadura spongiicola]RFS84793.1 translation initiation factor IF-2 [Actinomadura spongiicola]
MRGIVILLVGLLATGCGSAVAGSGEARAVEDARDNARDVARRFYIYNARVYPAEFVAHNVADLNGVEVMRFTGRTTAGDGVRVVVRVSGVALEGGWVPGEQVTVMRCFELRFATSADSDDDEPRDVTCPPGSPRTFKPWPKTPDIPVERLEKALPRVPVGGRVDEAKVRKAVASVRLDPAIHREFKTEGDVVGGLLWIKPEYADALDCVLLRVSPGRTSVWVPPRTQRMIGEGGCDVDNAIDPMPPPH